MEKCCKDCRHFSDAHYSRTYVSPLCTAHGGDDASFFRQNICGLDAARLYEPKTNETQAENKSPIQA